MCINKRLPIAAYHLADTHTRCQKIPARWYAAKEAFSKLPDGKIPKVKDLNEEFVRLLSEKKADYSEYKKIKKEMRDYQIAKQNVESFYAAQQSWDIEEDMKKKRQQER